MGRLMYTTPGQSLAIMCVKPVTTFYLSIGTNVSLFPCVLPLNPQFIAATLPVFNCLGPTLDPFRLSSLYHCMVYPK